MSGPANLDIIAATSFAFGDITVLARQSYLLYTRAHPSDNSNKWTATLPAVRDHGLIAWRVRYPQGPGQPNSDLGWSSVQATLCDFSTGDTVIDYDPMKLASVPQSASKSFFISTFWWGAIDYTSKVQSLLAADVHPSTFSIDPARLGPPPPGHGPNFPVFMVYGYIDSGRMTTSSAKSISLRPYFRNQQITRVMLEKLAPPTLEILGAFYGLSDVSGLLKSFIDGQQTLNLELSKLKHYFLTQIQPGDNAPVKVFSVLYRYYGSDMMCWASTATTGSLHISPFVQVSSAPNLCRRPRLGEDNVLALVWGDGSAVSPKSPQWPLAEIYNDKIFKSKTFPPKAEFFDGLKPGRVDTCHIYYQYGVTGDIRFMSGSASSRDIVLSDREVRRFDPPPARGLLRPEGPSPCFTLETTSILSLGVRKMPSNSTWQLVCGKDETPVVFKVVRRNTPSDGNSPFAMLKIYIEPIKKWAYLGLPTGATWSTIEAQSASFMVPGEGCSMNTNDWAFAFDYEIPSRNDKQGIMFGVSQYRSEAQPSYNRGFYIMHQDSHTSTVMLMPLQTALHDLPGTSFQPRCAADPSAASLNVHVMKEPDPNFDFMDSCLVQFLVVVKDFVWDAFCMYLGLRGLDHPIERVARMGKWWKELSKTARLAIVTYMQAVQLSIHESLEKFGEIPEAKIMFQSLHLIGVLYNGDALWSLIKNLNSELNWRDGLKLLLNLATIGLEIFQPEVSVFNIAVSVSAWLYNTTLDVMGFVKDCAQYITGLNGVHAMALVSKMKTAARTTKMLTLSMGDQTKVMQALVAPVLDQLTTSDLVMRGPHPLISHMAALKSDAGLQQQHMDHPYVDLFSGMNATAQAIAAELADSFTF